MIGLGIALGTIVGLLTDNLALWLSIGVAIGAGLSLRANQGEDDDRTD